MPLRPVPYMRSELSPASRSVDTVAQPSSLHPMKVELSRESRRGKWAELDNCIAEQSIVTLSN
ncbi:hypothetical protein PPGU16_82020 (plasmid) [Paraburkholderia largidicola]|uniref:Uncharacterized protein n=1 Tax=Paraburkholderia largidicola TaxID=3014751 RepID=A0A7I8C3D5_9BURK|nr:hypothetical protein PPGU16_82020 [Paraburkholderia sp. PGU16]